MKIGRTTVFRIQNKLLNYTFKLRLKLFKLILFRRITQYLPRNLANTNLKKVLFMKIFIKAIEDPDVVIIV